MRLRLGLRPGLLDRHFRLRRSQSQQSGARSIPDRCQGRTEGLLRRGIRGGRRRGGNPPSAFLLPLHLLHLLHLLHVHLHRVRSPGPGIDPPLSDVDGELPWKELPHGLLQRQGTGDEVGVQAEGEEVGLPPGPAGIGHNAPSPNRIEHHGAAIGGQGRDEGGLVRLPLVRRHVPPSPIAPAVQQIQEGAQGGGGEESVPSPSPSPPSSFSSSSVLLLLAVLRLGSSPSRPLPRKAFFTASLAVTTPTPLRLGQ